MLMIMSQQTTSNLGVNDSHMFGGRGHCVVGTSRKSKRICHSTSHGETLSYHGGMTSAQLLALRLTELLCPIAEPRLRTLMEKFDNGEYVIPVHGVTDCKDLLELATGERGIPADRSQRLAVLSIREERLSGRCRIMSHIPTQIMLSDALTKLGTFPVFNKYLTTGVWDTSLKPFVGSTAKSKAKLEITTRTIARRPEYTEDDLINLDYFASLD